MQSRMACDGTSTGEMLTPRSSRTLSSELESSGSATATSACASPSVSMRSGISLACLAKLMGTSLTSSGEISSGARRIWYGSSSCAASALSTCSSLHALREIRTSPSRPPRSACSASASAIFSCGTAPCATRISPIGRPARLAPAALARGAAVWARVRSIRTSTPGRRRFFRRRPLLRRVRSPLLRRVRRRLRLALIGRRSLLRRGLSATRGLLGAGRRALPFRHERGARRRLVARLVLRERLAARGHDHPLVGRPGAAVLGARQLRLHAAPQPGEHARLALVVDGLLVAFFGPVEPLHELGPLRHLALEDAPVVALVADDVGGQEEEKVGLGAGRVLAAEEPAEDGYRSEERDLGDALHGAFLDQAAEHHGLLVLHHHGRLRAALAGGRTELWIGRGDLLGLLVHLEAHGVARADLRLDAQAQLDVLPLDGSVQGAEAAQAEEVGGHPGGAGRGAGAGR